MARRSLRVSERIAARRRVLVGVLSVFRVAHIPADETEFSANVQLFDLLDDHVRETDSLTVGEILESRCVRWSDMAEVRERFDTSTDPTRESLSRWFGRERRDDNTVAEAIKTPDEIERIGQVLRGVNERTVLPLRVDPNNRRLVTAHIPDEPPYETMTPDLAIGLQTRDRPVGTLEAYVMYVHAYHLYEAYERVIARVELMHRVRISPVFLPRYTAWQRGLARTRATLVDNIAYDRGAVVRDNLYIERILVTLEFVNQYIWCGECKYHWTHTGGFQFLRIFTLAIAADEATPRCRYSSGQNSRLRDRYDTRRRRAVGRQAGSHLNQISRIRVDRTAAAAREQSRRCRFDDDDAILSARSSMQSLVPYRRLAVGARSRRLTSHPWTHF